MPLTHEFGIIDDINDKAYENYTPEKYNCISLDDEVILDLGCFLKVCGSLQ